MQWRTSVAVSLIIHLLRWRLGCRLLILEVHLQHLLLRLRLILVLDQRCQWLLVRTIQCRLMFLRWETMLLVLAPRHLLRLRIRRRG